MNNETPTQTIERIAKSYKLMPANGSTLSLSPKGFIGNGMCIVADFGNERAAKKSLKAAGFKKVGTYSWKLA